MRRALLCVLITLLLMTLLSLPVAAIDEDALFADFFAALPSDVAGELAGATTAEQAAELTGVGYLLSLFGNSLHRELTGALPLFGRLLGLSLILAVLARIGDGLGETTATRAAECGIAVVMVLLLYRTAEADIARTAATLGDMCRLSDGLLPVFCALFAAGGSGGTATAAAGGFTAVSYLLEHVAAGVLLPLLQVLFAFTLPFGLIKAAYSLYR